APDDAEVSAQVPAVTAAEQEPPVPSVTVTVPVGVPLPGAFTVTDQFTVYACPTTDGSRVSLVMVVGVFALLTVNVCAFETPPSGFPTVMLNVPALVRSLARMLAVRVVVPVPDVVRFEPSKRTTAPVWKFVPVTVMVKAASPTTLLVGKMLVVVGLRLKVTFSVFWPPPNGPVGHGLVVAEPGPRVGDQPAKTDVPFGVEVSVPIAALSVNWRLQVVVIVTEAVPLPVPEHGGFDWMLMTPTLTLIAKDPPPVPWNVGLKFLAAATYGPTNGPPFPVGGAPAGWMNTVLVSASARAMLMRPLPVWSWVPAGSAMRARRPTMMPFVSAGSTAFMKAAAPATIAADAEVPLITAYASPVAVVGMSVAGAAMKTLGP